MVLHNFCHTYLNTTDELQRHVHTSSIRGAIYNTRQFLQKKVQFFALQQHIYDSSHLVHLKSLSATESFASVNLCTWEQNIWEHTEERHQFPNQLFLDGLTTSVVSMLLNKPPAFFQTSLSHHRPPCTCRIDKALCRSTRSLVCTHHTWHLKGLQMCIQFHTSWGPSSQQRGKAQLFTKTCVRNMGTS